jgi:MoxR-like ATPase
MQPQINKPYTGKKLEKGDEDLRLTPYFATPSLQKAVNLACFLGRPLLLTGDLGCGKTLLATSVAYEWYGKNYKNYFRAWHIKSTTKAQDGLYTFDSLRRLQDAQIAGKELQNAENYITWRYLGDAFKNVEQENPFVVLIDEIDKASIDFPNDLLLELDKSEFFVPELGANYKITAQVKPLVIITSNNEKDLPAAFLRRCVYCHIQPLQKEILSNILKANQIMDSLIDKGLDIFMHLRDNQLSKGAGNKTVSTSELLDWLRFLSYASAQGEQDAIQTQLGKCKEAIVEKKPLPTLPYFQALLKTEQEQNRQIHGA